jgi:polyhydroxybutyrate depolymerase
MSGHGMMARPLRGLLPILAFLVGAACFGGQGSRVDDAPGGRQTLTHDGRARSYVLRLPPSLGRGAPVPLVLVLHGGGGNASNAERMTGFTPLAGAEGFIVAYPEGTARGRAPMLTWNAGHCCGYAMQNRVDDVGFLAALIDHLGRRYPIDPKRVYLTGMSNGAMMAHRAGIELSDRVAAIAPVAGAVFGDEPAPRARVSALMINGMQDRAVPYDGGAPGGRFADTWDGSPVRPALDQARFWAGPNGCAPPATRETAAYTHVRYACTEAVGVELYGVRDQGHAWPGGARGSRLGDVPTRSLDASRVIWTFFLAHPKT